MHFTTVIHPVRKALGITPFDYMVVDMIGISQNNPHYSKNGWCKVSNNTLAGFIGISRRSVTDAINKLKSLGLVITNGHLKQATELWFSTLENGKKVLKIGKWEESSQIPKREENSHRNGKKVPGKREESSHHNIKGNLKGSNNIISTSKNSDSLNQDVKEDAEEKKKVAVKKKSAVTQKAVTFSSTKYYEDYSLFESKFEGSKYDSKIVDLEYYYESVKNWADSTGNKRKDWIAVTRTFILRDVGNNKLKTKFKSQNLNSDGKATTKSKVIDPDQIRRVIESRNNGK